MKQEKESRQRKKFRCRFCGFECYDKAPEFCPVCGASEEDLEEV